MPVPTMATDHVLGPLHRDPTFTNLHRNGDSMLMNSKIGISRKENPSFSVYFDLWWSFFKNKSVLFFLATKMLIIKKSDIIADIRK